MRVRVTPRAEPIARRLMEIRVTPNLPLPAMRQRGTEA